MTEAKIILKQPSIQSIELKPQPNKSLSQQDVKRLFEGSSLPKFDLADIKLQGLFCKREKAHYFMGLIQKWNQRMDDNEYLKINARTEFSLIEFIFSSIKRICMMGDHEIDKQLALLYSWFLRQSKNSSDFCRATMPRKKCQNQYYNVTKSFKTNPTLLIRQYIRPRCLLGELNKENRQPNAEESVVMGHRLRLKPQKSHNEEWTDFFDGKKSKDNFFQTQQKQSEYKCLLTENSANKIMNEQLRKHYQQREMEKQGWNFKLKKGRFLSQNTKAYLTQKTNVMPRVTKTSEGSRNGQKQILESMKKMRVQTSMGKRIPPAVQNNQRNTLITEVSSLGLLSNPFEVKLKLKKKKVKSKK